MSKCKKQSYYFKQDYLMEIKQIEIKIQVNRCLTKSGVHDLN